MNVCYSPEILEEMDIRKGFREFLKSSIKKFLFGNYGEVAPEEAEHNNHNPQAAIGAYMYRDEIKVYLKAENGCLRAFLPEEC